VPIAPTRIHLAPTRGSAHRTYCTRRTSRTDVRQCPLHRPGSTSHRPTAVPIAPIAPIAPFAPTRGSTHCTDLRRSLAPASG